MSAYFSRLKLNVQAPLKLKDLTYKFVVTTNSTKKKIVFDGRFNDEGLTSWTQINNLNTTLIYEIYLRGELLQKVSVKAYPDRKTHSIYTIKTTTEITKKVKENIKEIYLNDGEVAWYLIKRKETMLDWSKRVFKKPLTSSDWDMLKANNPHLANIAPITILRPGQVVILSNSTAAKQLPKYKKDAQQAQKNLERMMKDKDFDAQFFAQNYEFFYDSLKNHRPQVTNKNIFGDNNPLAVKFESDSKEGFLETKMVPDAALVLAEGAMGKIYQKHGELAKRWAEERSRNLLFSQQDFERRNSKLYNELRSVKGILRWDQSISTHNMRNIISQSAMARNENYRGGIKAYIEQMSEIGKMSKVLKAGGYLSLAVDVVNSGVEVANAKPADKTRTAVVETTKIVSGIGAGAITSILIIGLASGGTGLVVIGIAAIVAPMAGKVIGDGMGWGAGKIYDVVESNVGK
ncbi:hypothetical protein [Acinetobacter oleivorans]|uniref:hypothetical protein n=1 Tax=Acinetobacter oleivorans TaxID=1148157 RepID=UPI0018FF82E2|nr:hypothetical protein [Acinetobacter oleivorans]MBJ8498874.1 hypothetical protein [Acinetobacter oleivorans]